jgi:hypothetical protein
LDFTGWRVEEKPFSDLSLSLLVKFPVLFCHFLALSSFVSLVFLK